MLEYFKLYLPLSKREVKICVSSPRHKENIKFDTLYFLDGQNAFKDSNASFGRSIRATKYLSIAAKEMNKRIIGVAIYNSGSEMGRINEYSPFKITNAAMEEWANNDPNECHNFCNDFINTIIPFIDSKYNTNKQNRYIYGSSLAATTALYLTAKYDAFKVAGCFSTASFLFKKAFTQFLNKANLENKKFYLYIGKKESSDELYTSELYLNESIRLHVFFNKKNIDNKLSISINGIHTEECWERHLLEFIAYAYSNDINYTL